MKLTVLILVSFLTSCSLLKKPENEINVVHWNIKEFNSTKLNKKNPQFAAVDNILKELNFDILSINELQYDTKNVPNSNYRSSGKNAQKLISLMKEDPLNYAISFNQANTGNKAKTYNKGKYATQMSRRTRKLTDPNNFGLFPGHYSSALISKYPIKKEIVISKLKWREFNPDINLKKFRNNSGKVVSKDIELFDKNFSDITIEVDGKDIHVIMLHAVPAFHFGNKRSVNYERNRDQLRFLEWYRTGGTDLAVNLPKKYSHIRPLNQNDAFIALGDWNTSIDANNKGSVVLRRMIKQVKLWIQKPGFTHEDQHFGKKRMKLLLDYIAYRGVTLKDSGIYLPDEQSGICTSIEDIPRSLWPRVGGLDKDKCYNEDSVELKKASDHFPIWAKFKVK